MTEHTVDIIKPGESKELDFPLSNASGNKYREETREDGHVLRVFIDGTVYDYTAKRLIRGADQAIKRFKDAPREMQKLGQEAIKQDILEGARRMVAVVDGEPVTRVTDAKVRQSFGYALMERVHDKESVSGVQAAKLFADIQEWTPRPVKLRDGDGNSAEGTPGALAELIELRQYVQALLAQKASE